MHVGEVCTAMSLREKIAFCTGGDFWRTKQLEQYGIPSVMMADGTHGLRCQAGKADMVGVNNSLPATCFPAAVTAGATWNPDLYAAEGAAIGREALAAGVSVVLGRGCNIKRNPLGGRNFEYIAEDPFVAGKMAAAFIRGLHGTGACASLKHFAANSQEYKRMNGDSQMDERTLREIYLTAFEIAVKEGRPATVMCAYNKINGEHCSDSKTLLTDILRSEWGFDGTVITDWGAMNDRIRGFQAGCDLNMPGGSDYMEQAVMEAVKTGVLSEKDIDASVDRILRLAAKAQAAKATEVNWNAHHALAREIAEQGAVLLKNEDGILPLHVLDHMEWKTGFRSDGIAMSVYNIIAVAMVGICTGIFNGMLAGAGYVAPEIVNGVTVAAAQTGAVKSVITCGFVGLEVITGVMLAVLLIFLNVEKDIGRKQAEIKARRAAK